MKRDFAAPILDLQGQPMRIGLSQETLMRAIGELLAGMPQEVAARFEQLLNKHAGAAMTLGSCAADALGAPYDDERGLALDERMKRFKLALKVVGVGELEITPEERDIVKNIIPRRYIGSIVAPRCAQVLEGEDQ